MKTLINLMLCLFFVAVLLVGCENDNSVQSTPQTIGFDKDKMTADFPRLSNLAKVYDTLNMFNIKLSVKDSLVSVDPYGFVLEGYLLIKFDNRVVGNAPYEQSHGSPYKVRPSIYYCYIESGEYLFYVQSARAFTVLVYKVTSDNIQLIPVIDNACNKQGILTKSMVTAGSNLYISSVKNFSGKYIMYLSEAPNAYFDNFYLIDDNINYCRYYQNSSMLWWTCNK